MAELVPHASGLRRTHAWTCFRPCCSDELPAIDLVPGLSNAWVAMGLFSTGILMSPVVGQLVCGWITGDGPDKVASFGLGRLKERR
jgi:glycine/D-amino acid oxidase-like deaminating enzyme